MGSRYREIQVEGTANTLLLLAWICQNSMYVEVTPLPDNLWELRFRDDDAYRRVTDYMRKVPVRWLFD